MAAEHAEPRLRAYRQLAKLYFFDFYLNIPLVWSLVPRGQQLRPRVLLLLALMLIGEACLLIAMVSLDDRQGFLDGSDETNYSGGRVARKRSRKPLLDGRITPRQAAKFAAGIAVVALTLGGIGLLVTPYLPLWVRITAPALVVAALNYSWGLRLSYRGFQEFLIFAGGTFLVWAPYACISETLNSVVVIEGILFGLWMILVSAYSNTHDVVGDRKAGRRNLATSTSTRGNRAFIVALTSVEFSIIVVALVARLVPVWFLPAFAIVFALRLRQLHAALGRNQILEARLAGIRIHRVGVLMLIMTNIAVERLT